LGPVLRQHQQAGLTMTLARHVGAAIVTAVVIWALSVSLSSFRDYQIADIAVYVVAIAGLTVLIGLSGQISLGNGAFMAIGAYATALLQMHLGWPLWALFPASAAIAAVAGVAVGAAAARLHGPHPAGAPRRRAAPVPPLPPPLPGVLGGARGLPVPVPPPAALGAAFPLTRWLAWVNAGTALIVLVLLANLARSRVGRSWQAVRDDEAAAALAGLNVARLRIL